MSNLCRLTSHTTWVFTPALFVNECVAFLAREKLFVRLEAVAAEWASLGVRLAELLDIQHDGCPGLKKTAAKASATTVT